jgi:phage gpG-like protein
VAKASGPFGDRMATTLAGKVPVLTGQLAGSASASSTDDGFELELGADVDHAGWIEFGGSRGRPYIAEGRYVYPTALEATDEFAELAAETATDSAARFSWSKAH